MLANLVNCKNGFPRQQLHRGVAYLVERYVRDVEAGGSNPLTPTISSPNSFLLSRITLLVHIPATQELASAKTAERIYSSNLLIGMNLDQTLGRD